MLEDYFLSSYHLDINVLKDTEDLADTVRDHIEKFTQKYQNKILGELIDIIEKNDYIMAVLKALEDTDLEYYLGAGALVQTVWNYKTHRDLNYGIEDMDIVYYDPDHLSLEDEKKVKERLEERLGDFPIWLDVKNQARVHLWYEDKFGYKIEPYQSLEEAIDTWPTTATALGIRKKGHTWQVYAPYGLYDLMNLQVVANNRQITKAIYEKKQTKWKGKWPELQVKDWNNQRIEKSCEAVMTHERKNTYIGDIDYWDEKFKNRKNPLGPDQELVDHLSYLKKGTVLDLACGDGRNSLYLHQEGFQVTGVDFSIEALRKLEAYSKDAVQTIQMDFTKDGLKALATYDNIIINHYRLPQKHMKALKSLLNEGGILLVNGFSHLHTSDEKIKKQDLINFEDFNDLQMPCIKTHAYADQRGNFVTYIFRK